MDAALVGAALLALALPLSIALTNVTLGLLSAAALISQPRWDRLKDPVFLLLLAYIGAASICAALCPAPGDSLRAVLKDAHKVWALGLFLIALRPDRRVLPALAAGFAAAAAIGVAQTIPGFPLVEHPWHWRAHAFVHPVTFGEQMALAVLGGLCFFGRADARLDSRGAKIIVAVFTLLCAAALVLSRTRGAIVGLAAGMLAGALLDRRFLRWLPLLAFGGVAFFLRHPVHGPTSTLEARDVLWDVAWRMFKDHPWTGAGPGQYRALFGSYYSGLLEGETSWGSAHNLYLHQLAERGVLGICALAALLGAMTWRAFQGARRDPSPWRLWAFTGTAAFLVMNLTETAFQVELVATLFLFLWAWGASSESRVSGAI